MGQSISRNYLHLVFGTKGRLPLITETVEKKLHAYMAGIFKNVEVLL